MYHYHLHDSLTVDETLVKRRLIAPEWGSAEALGAYPRLATAGRDGALPTGGPIVGGFARWRVPGSVTHADAEQVSAAAYLALTLRMAALIRYCTL